MLREARSVMHGRYISVLVLLLATWVASSRLRQVPPSQLPASPALEKAGYVLFADSEGWYRISPYEAALVSPFRLTLDGLPDALPEQLGEWKGVDMSLGPEIATWFLNPEVAMQRAYTDPRGRLIWLSLFGHHGPESFSLFEHTPASCYPLSGWAMLDETLVHVPVGRGSFPARLGIARRGDVELVVLYWYLWDNPQRLPEDGVISVRLSAPVVGTPEETLNMLTQEFIPLLFTDVLPWHRF